MAVAIAAPFAGVIGDRLGRKRVIVPAAFLLVLPTVLAATSQNLGQLIFWRFWQGVFTPGIFVITIAYINEEWETGAGAAVAAYVTGTVVGGFCGRMVAGMVAAHASWRWSFVVLGLLNALGGVAIWAWLPAGRRFVRARRGSPTVRPMLRHLRNPQLLATYAVAFCVMFTLLATFTYINFYLAAPPFGLGTEALALLFVVYLVGAVITPFAGRSIDRLGHRAALVLAFSGGILGIALTLAHSLPVVMLGLALCCTGVFIANSAGASYVGTGGARGAGGRGGAVCDLLLHRRQFRLGRAGTLLEPRGMAGLRGPDRQPYKCSRSCFRCSFGSLCPNRSAGRRRCDDGRLNANASPRRRGDNGGRAEKDKY